MRALITYALITKDLNHYGLETWTEATNHQRDRFAHELLANPHKRSAMQDALNCAFGMTATLDEFAFDPIARRRRNQRGNRT